MNKITDILSNKKILIWGYGREGKSTENFIKNHCDVLKADIFEGSESEVKAGDYDIIIKSPGIKVEKYIEKYTSQTELFLSQFARQTIGITGTKGKSTTSSLTAEVLSKCSGKKVLLVGNIGLPCLDYYDEIDEDTVIVFEMSCHQLSHIHYSPHIAVFLNLFQDHLDYYGTVEKYFEAKQNIASHQSENDICYIGDQVPFFEKRSKEIKVFYDEPMNFNMLLKGKHNQYNAAFVYKIATEQFGCDPEKVIKVIDNFHGLSHRLEYVGKKCGVEYYNDSISTIPEATIQAAMSIPNVKTIIIGGMDRGIDYGKLVKFVKEHPDYNFVFSYESGKRIYKEVSGLDYCRYCADLDESVKTAKIITPKGFAVLFSPAAASYGYFKNFEERGEYFKKLVLNS